MVEYVVCSPWETQYVSASSLPGAISSQGFTYFGPIGWWFALASTVVMVIMLFVILSSQETAPMTAIAPNQENRNCMLLCIRPAK